jgi:hypothetical protein
VPLDFASKGLKALISKAEFDQMIATGLSQGLA